MAKRSHSHSHSIQKKNHHHANKRSRKNHIPEPIDLPSPSSSEEEEEKDTTLSRNESSEEEAEAAPVYKEPSMYDNLLSSLSSGNKTLATICRRRQSQEQGLSESESESEQDKGNDLEFNTQESGDDQAEEEESDAESEDLETDQASETDEDGDDVNEIDESAGTSSTSSFSVHTGRVLTQAEVLDLPKKKWKFEWQVPIAPASKWLGTGECFLNEDADESSNYGLQSKLYKHWLGLYESSGGKEFHSSRQRRFFTLCNSYRDIMHCNKRPFYMKAGAEEDLSTRDAYIVHALNHVFRARDVLMRNEAKLAKLGESNKDGSLDGAGFLDRGFNRPKVLILLPLQVIAFRLVKRLIELTPASNKVNVENWNTFFKKFGGEDIDDNGNELFNKEEESQKSSKPSDHQALFGGNNEDNFMMGIKFTRRAIKLCSDFYTSDVIVASPIGIMKKMNDDMRRKDKDFDYDYLSSIEVLIIDHADVISMQNWSNVNSVVELLNQIPSKQHGTDIMRIRQWYLDGHARFYRQTILLGFYLTPEINSFFNHQCLNYQGKVKSTTEHKGVLSKLLLPVRQIYERFDATSIIDADDARFDYFVNKVFPKMKDPVEGGTMLFISSYFEFVRIRNFMKSQNSSVCLVGDYTKQADISRARGWFFQGKRKIMLYTERIHFNYRYNIRGVKNLIFYSLPERKEFYPEIIGMLENSEDMSTTVLFSSLDQLRLERIVGKRNTKRLMSSEKRIFVFC